MDFANINGVKLAYTHRGQGTPLVLVHGYPLDHTIWDDVIPLLENDFDLLLFDLRGFGESGLVETKFTIADMASDIAGLLDLLRIEKTMIAGHSMGGYVALAFARAYLDRTLGLGLVASQTLADSSERKQGRYQAAVAIMQSGVAQVAEDMSGKLTSDERVQTYVRGLIGVQRPAGLAGALKAMAEREDMTPLLSTFDFPVVLVHGNADVLIPVERAYEIKATLTQAVLVELPGACHMPMMEFPQETTTALKQLGKSTEGD